MAEKPEKAEVPEVASEFEGTTPASAGEPTAGAPVVHGPAGSTGAEGASGAQPAQNAASDPASSSNMFTTGLDKSLAPLSRSLCSPPPGSEDRSTTPLGETRHHLWPGELETAIDPAAASGRSDCRDSAPV